MFFFFDNDRRRQAHLYISLDELLFNAEPAPQTSMYYCLPPSQNRALGWVSREQAWVPRLSRGAINKARWERACITKNKK